MKIVYRNGQNLENSILHTAHFEKAELSPAVTLWIEDEYENVIVFRRDDALALRDYINQHFGRSDK